MGADDGDNLVPMDIVYVTNGVKNIPNKTQYQHSQMLVENHAVVTVSQGDVAPFVKEESQAFYNFSEYHGPQFLFPYWAAVVATYYFLIGYETIYTTHSPQCLILGIFTILPRVSWIADIWDDPRLGQQIGHFKKSDTNQFLPEKPYSQVVILIAFKLLQHCDLVILSISEEILDGWPVNITADQIFATTNGVDIEYTRSAVNEILTEDPDNEETLDILYVGHVGRMRGLEVIVDAAVQLAEAHSQNFRISLVGPIGKTDRDWLEEKIGKYNIEDSINICGEVDHKSALNKMSKSDICLNILPKEVNNYKFAYPIKIFEYMALGKPTISTKTVGTNKILTDRSNAILLPNNEPDSVVEGLVELSNNEELRREMGANAMKEAENYDWRSIRSSILERISQQ